MMRSLALVSAVALTVLLAAPSAHASGSDVGMFFAETFVTRTRLQSPMAVNGNDAPRSLVGLGVPAGDQTFVGVGVGLQARDGWFSGRTFEFRYSNAPSGTSGAATVGGGVPVSAKTGSIQVLEFGTSLPIPGVQYVDDERYWKVSLNVVWGVSYTTAEAMMLVSGSATPAKGKITQVDGYVRADVGVCKGIDRGISWEREPVSWACLVAEPSIYAHDFLPGASLALRVDF